jgi:hypothetical protein
MANTQNTYAKWDDVYKLGGAAAVGAVLVGVIEILITFLPGGNVYSETVLDWFALFQGNWFMGLRNLGLLNIFLNLLGIFTYMALYAAHRKSEIKSYALLAMVISYLGIAVFLATNRAFPMLALSQSYAAATTEAQKTVLEAAGQAMLSVGESHSPGTFLAFTLSESAGILVSIVMLRGGVFKPAAAYAGIIGFSVLLVFECISSFVSGLTNSAMILAGIGGIFSMAWHLLIARQLFQLAKSGNGS